jgi:hypothetical protein
MAKHEEIALGTVLADPAAVFDRVESDRLTLSVMRGNVSVAVISPGPVAKSPSNIHQEPYKEPHDPEFFLDAIETRRLLGL